MPETITKFKGIYSEETLECGCIIKRYINGLDKLVPDINCKKEPRHVKTELKWFCRPCGKQQPSKIVLDKHKWSHAL